MVKTRDDSPLTQEEKEFYKDFMKNCVDKYKKKIKLGAGIPFEHDHKNENDDVFTEIRNEWKQGED